METNNDLENSVNIKYSVGKCDIDLKELKFEIMKLFKSVNPFDLLANSNSIRDKFSKFIVCVTNKISDGFDLVVGKENFISYIYEISNYDEVWIYNLKNYLKELKYIDLSSFFYVYKSLDKKNEALSIFLYKLYAYKKGNIQKSDIENMIKNDKSGSFEQARNIFSTLDLLNLDIKSNIGENEVEYFLETVYFTLDYDKKDLFLEYFNLDFENINFQDINNIFTKIVNNYAFSEKFIYLENKLKKEEFRTITQKVDTYIKSFYVSRNQFLLGINEILFNLNIEEKQNYKKYINTLIINNYFKDLCMLFYQYSSSVFMNNSEWNNLKGKYKLEIKNAKEYEEFNKQIVEIVELKEMLIELNKNLLSTFLLPIVYNILSEKVSLKKNDLLKLKYLILYIFSENYSEYKNLYLFFNQFEVFINYDSIDNKVDKLKISFSIILLSTTFFIFSYLYLPAGIFLGFLILFFAKSFEILYPNIYFKGKYNFGLKFFASLLLLISGFSFIQNTQNIKSSTSNITKRIMDLGYMKTPEFLGKLYYKVSK